MIKSTFEPIPVSAVFFILFTGSLWCSADSKTAGDESPHTGPAATVDKELDSSVIDPDYVRELAEKKQHSVQDSPPEHLQLDPMFAEFPDLFRAPEIEFDSLSEIERRRDMGYRAQFELGLQHRRAGEYEFAVAALVKLLEKRPPESYRKQIMMQLALIAELRGQWVKAQQIYRHFESLYPDDPNIPLVNLRLGEVYREMGADELALSSFHTLIMNSVRADVVQGKYFPLYRRIVLKAKTEIANTYMDNGDYESAARHFRMLAVDDAEDDPFGRINRPTVQLKLCQCLSVLKDHDALDAAVRDFIGEHAGHELEADVRYLAVQSLQERRRHGDVLKQFKKILELESRQGDEIPAVTARWKLRIGLEVASQMVQAADYLDSLQVYEALLGIVQEPNDEVAVRYQMGLVYERLHQPARAMAAYRQIQDLLGPERDSLADSAGLVSEMAGWRIGMLDWFRKKQLVLERMKDENLSRSGASDE